MKIKERVGLAIYLYYNRDARKLSKLGDILYHSKRFKYLMMYIDKEQEEDIVATLKTMKFVKKVKPSALDDIDMNFVGNLENTEQIN
ncbi:DUF2129 domain-containing protein [Streptococcus thoraltensis]|uniref:DUF2129 domain-containing protein n=1 Tax=Streptococcus thoraltensis TaxID=55085 RepID=UPI00036571F8|nr:DUF2129 domain-containing protein [Streptococcus thoraltensis]MDY4761320.1 DUF2129 domain-containing protein [Streptococcus thoraltensis]